MMSVMKLGRLVGLLFLSIFILGIFVYQILQGPILFADDFIRSTASNSNEIILSTLLLFLSALFGILIAVLLFPLFKTYNHSLAILYLVFCILSFITITIDNFSVLSLLELSQDYIKNASVNSEFYSSLSKVYFKQHWWTHYMSLLISCFPVFILYYSFYKTKLIPSLISIFGIFAIFLMFIELLFSLFGQSISMNMLIPIGLIQLILPIYLLIKGLKSPSLENYKK